VFVSLGCNCLCVWAARVCVSLTCVSLSVYGLQDCVCLWAGRDCLSMGCKGLCVVRLQGFLCFWAQGS
jgi:hypothetical protein